MVAVSNRNYFLDVTSCIFDVGFGVVYDHDVRWVSCVEISRPHTRVFESLHLKGNQNCTLLNY